MGVSSHFYLTKKRYKKLDVKVSKTAPRNKEFIQIDTLVNTTQSTKEHEYALRYS